MTTGHAAGAAPSTTTTSAPSFEDRLVLPEDWWVIPLASSLERANAIEALVDHQTKGLDVTTAVRDVVLHELATATETAAERGGRLYAISLQEIAGTPLTVTLVVCREPGTLDTVRAHLDKANTDADETISPAGPIIRSTQISSGALAGETQDIDLLIVDYWLDPYDGNGLFHASFTTRHVDLEDAMLTVFDAIIAAAVFDGPDDDALDDEPEQSALRRRRGV